MKEKMMSAYIKMQTALHFGVKNFKENEKGAVNVVEIVVIIGIVVLLALIFKDKIKDLLDSLFTTIGGSANNAVSG